MVRVEERKAIDMSCAVMNMINCSQELAKTFLDTWTMDSLPDKGLAALENPLVNMTRVELKKIHEIGRSST